MLAAYHASHMCKHSSLLHPVAGKAATQCADRHASPCTEGQTVHSGPSGEEDDSLHELQEAVSNLKEQCASVRPLRTPCTAHCASGSTDL